MRARHLLRDDRGQAMVLTTVTIFVALLMGALAIDAARWYQKHHQAQVAADSASLAAATCLANGSPGETCTSTTDTADAAKVATTIASDYGVTLSTGQVMFPGGGKVVVNDGTSSPSVFANVAGIKTGYQSAAAGAAFTAASHTTTTTTTPSTITTTATITTPTTTTTATTTTTPTTTTNTTTTPITGSPLALFSMDANCSDNGVYMQGGSETVNGGVWSNSSLYLDPGGSSYESLTYGVGSSCQTTTEGGGGTYTDGSPQQATTDLTTWPVPYGTSADPLPACTNTYGGSGTWDIGNQPATTPQVFCYPGGAILLTGSSDYSDDTFESGSFSVQGGGIGLEAENYPANKLLIYATGTGSNVVNLTNGAGVVKGDVDAPNGQVGFDSGSNAFTGLLEAQDVNFSGGSSTITGDGPTTYGYTTTTSTGTGYNTTTTYNTTTNYNTTTTTGTTVTSTTTTATVTTPGSDGLVQ